MLKNPFYAGAYVYGKSQHRTEIVEGRARKSYGHGKPLEEWEAEIFLQMEHLAVAYLARYLKCKPEDICAK